MSSTVIERVRIPADLATQVASVPGVAERGGRRVVPRVRRRGRRARLRPGWDPVARARVEQFVHHAVPPRGRQRAHRRGRCRHRRGRWLAAPVWVSATPRPRVVSGRNVDVNVTGVVQPAGGRPLSEQSAVFFSDAAAALVLPFLRPGRPAGGDRRRRRRHRDGGGLRRGRGRHGARGADRRRARQGRVPGRVRLEPPPDRDQRLPRRHRPVRGRARAGRHDHPVRAAAAARDRPPPGVGAQPRQVRRLPVARDADGHPRWAPSSGCGPGFWLAGLLAGAMRDKGLLPGTFEVTAGVWPPVAAVAAVLLVSQVAAYLAGRKAAKVRPVEALSVAASSPRRDRVATGLRGRPGRRGHGRAVPGRRLGPAVDRAGPGARDAHVGHHHGRPVWTAARDCRSAGRGPPGRPPPRSQRVPSGRQRQVAGASGGVGGHPAGAHGRGCLHDPLPAVDAGGRVEGPARGSGHGRARHRRRLLRTAGHRGRRAGRTVGAERWWASRTPASTATTSSTRTPPRSSWATRSTACSTSGSREGSLTTLGKDEVALSEDAAAGLGRGTG